MNRRRSRYQVTRGERLEPRAMLATTVPPDITSSTVELDDNVLVDAGAATIEATTGYVQIFGNSRGRIDAVTAEGTAALTLKAAGAITVTGAIGSVTPFDSLTLWSSSGAPVNLQQAVTLDDDLVVTKAGSFSVGSTLVVGDDLTITDATTVLFAGNVTVDGDLTITNATSVTFAGTLTVGGVLTITNATGTTRFTGDVAVGGAAITSTTLVTVQAGFTSTGVEAVHDGDVSFTTNQINLTTATLGTTSVVDAAPAATLVIQPRDAARALTIASPPGVPAGLVITDADIFAIQAGWKRVVFGDESAGTGAVKVGSIGSQYGGFSQLLNTTTIVGGSVAVVQPIDATSEAIYLDLIARGTGSGAGAGITIDAPINQTADERNEWVRLTSAGPIAINAPIWAVQTVSLTTTAGGTVVQSGESAAITAPSLAVVSDGGVILADSGNAVSIFAARTTNDGIVFREDSGYSIGQITTIDERRDVPQTVTVTGIQAGTADVRLVTVSGETPSTVTQGRPIIAAGLGLEGIGTEWNLPLATNDVGTLAADTATIAFRDDGGITVGGLAALPPRGALDGLRSSGTTGTVITLTSAGGITLAEDIATAGGDVRLDGNVTVSQPVTVDLRGAGMTGRLTVTGGLGGAGPLTLASDLTVQGAISLTDPIQWRVSSLADAGSGSLRWAIENANASKYRGTIVFDVFGPLLSPPVPTVISLQSALPTVATNLLFDGTAANIVLDGGRRVATGLDYASAASGSVLRSVTLRNFTGFGVQLVSAQNMLVDTITVQSLNTSTSMGLRANGDLSGTKVVGSTFSGGLRGALLASARNLVFGELGRGNTLSNNRAAPRQPKFAGTGIRSEGDCAGTVVEGNTFTNNNYGFAFIGARNLTLRNNVFNRNSTAGIYIEGDSSGSTQTNNTFGTGRDRNRVNVLRAKRSLFG